MNKKHKVKTKIYMKKNSDTFQGEGGFEIAKLAKQFLDNTKSSKNQASGFVSGLKEFIFILKDFFYNF